jgi:hypothetical protein
MFQLPKESGVAARTLPPQPTEVDELPLHVREHLRKLRLILAVISVSVLALHRQNAELDDDIATILDRHACEPLDFEIDHLESILSSLACRNTRKEVHA